MYQRWCWRGSIVVRNWFKKKAQNTSQQPQQIVPFVLSSPPPGIDLPVLLQLAVLEQLHWLLNVSGCYSSLVTSFILFVKGGVWVWIFPFCFLQCSGSIMFLSLTSFRLIVLCTVCSSFCFLLLRFLLLFPYFICVRVVCKNSAGTQFCWEEVLENQIRSWTPSPSFYSSPSAITTHSSNK